MKKSNLQILIVFVTVLILSTGAMAEDKKAHGWWNPFSSLWNAVHQLQDEMSTINKQVDDMAALTSQAGDVLPTSNPGIETGGGPLVCPGCYFPAGVLGAEYKERLKGAFLPYVRMAGTDLSNVDLSDADLRGAVLADCNFFGADFSGADLSPVTFVIGGKPYESPTDFTNANLENADLTGAEGLDQVKWSNTICPNGENSNAHGQSCLDQLKL